MLSFFPSFIRHDSFVLVNVTFSPSAYPGLLHVEVCQEVYENLQELCVRASIRRAKMLEKSSSLVLFVCFLSCVPAPFGNSSKREGSVFAPYWCLGPHRSLLLHRNPTKFSTYLPIFFSTIHASQKL
jgi:hypothetical protein